MPIGNSTLILLQSHNVKFPQFQKHTTVTNYMQKILFRDTRHQNLPDVFAAWNVKATAATKFGDMTTALKRKFRCTLYVMQILCYK